MEPKNKKWRYDRDHITDLAQLDEKLAQRGNRGWELATVIHANEAKTTTGENILAPEGWTLIFKQPAT
jgi:hypothetical protein